MLKSVSTPVITRQNRYWLQSFSDANQDCSTTPARWAGRMN